DADELVRAMLAGEAEAPDARAEVEDAAARGHLEGEVTSEPSRCEERAREAVQVLGALVEVLEDALALFVAESPPGTDELDGGLMALRRFLRELHAASGKIGPSPFQARSASSAATSSSDGESVKTGS